MSSPNEPFTTREEAEAMEQIIHEYAPQVITEIRHDRFDPQHWFVDVKWENNLQLVIRSAKSWDDRKYLFAPKVTEP